MCHGERAHELAFSVKRREIFLSIFHLHPAEEKSNLEKMWRDWCVWATKLDDKLKRIHLSFFYKFHSLVCVCPAVRDVFCGSKMKFEYFWFEWCFSFSIIARVGEWSGMSLFHWMGKWYKIYQNFNLITTKIEWEEIQLKFELRTSLIPLFFLLCLDFK